MDNDIKIPCTPKIAEFLNDIATEMVLLFSVTLDEAVGRINRFWSGQKFMEEVDEIDLFHETPEYWAKTIYYGADVMWWLGEEGLRPKPYP